MAETRAERQWSRSCFGVIQCTFNFSETSHSIFFSGNVIVKTLFLLRLLFFVTQTLYYRCSLAVTARAFKIYFVDVRTFQMKNKT